MKKHFYPAVFQKEDVGYSVFFPDLPGCVTEGDTLEEAYEMASEALGLYLQDQASGNFSYPEPTEFPMTQLAPGQTVVLIEFDELAYRKKYDARAVKKTLTIPNWLNIQAEQAGINFSQTLQNALKQQLNIK